MTVALDPGGTTGWAELGFVKGELTFYTLQFGPHIHLDELYRRLRMISPARIVCESFQQRAVEGLDLTPVEVIGVVALYTLQQHGNCELIMQSKSSTEFWSNDKIKKLGLWESGKPHAMDALRHLLTDMQRTHDPYIPDLLEKLR
jgi:hypothetical protein